MRHLALYALLFSGTPVPPDTDGNLAAPARGPVRIRSVTPGENLENLPAIRPIRANDQFETSASNPQNEPPGDEEVFDLAEVPSTRLSDQGLAVFAPPGSLLGETVETVEIEPMPSDFSAIGGADAGAWPPVSVVSGVTEVPRSVLSLVIAPVKEANLLLPERLDPFSDTTSPLALEAAKEEEEFNLAKQRQLLGFGLTAKPNVPGLPVVSDKWRWQVETGGSFRQGNTSNTNVRSMFRTERYTEKYGFMGRVAVTYNRNGDDDVNRQAIGEFLLERNLRGRWVWYGRENLEYDQARLINLRYVTSSGLGFKFINKLRSRLVVRTGPTVTYITYAPRADNDAEFRGGWLLESDYRRMLGESVRIEWISSMFPDFDSDQQLRLRNEAALLFPIGGKASPWNWKLGVQHDYQLNPVTTVKPNDVFGYFSIAYLR